MCIQINSKILSNCFYSVGSSAINSFNKRILNCVTTSQTANPYLQRIKKVLMEINPYFLLYRAPVACLLFYRSRHKYLSKLLLLF